LKGGPLLDLGLLQFAKQFVFKSLQIHALLLVLSDFRSHFMCLMVNLLAGILSLLFDKIILFGKTVSFLLTDLLLAELCLIVILFAHAIQVMFHRFFLPTHFLNSCHLLVPKVPVAEQDLLFLFLFSLASVFAILLLLLLPSLLFTTSNQNFVVVLILQVL
jgi:hypothetical protein